jgi:hypothetical protein
LGGFETPAENGTDSKVSQAVCNSAVMACFYSRLNQVLEIAT